MCRAHPTNSRSSRRRRAYHRERTDMKRISLWKTSSIGLGIAFVGLSCMVACGGAKTEPSSPQTKTTGKEGEKDDGVLRSITQGQLKVAHYATGDGTVG